VRKCVFARTIEIPGKNPCPTEHKKHYRTLGSGSVWSALLRLKASATPRRCHLASLDSALVTRLGVDGFSTAQTSRVRRAG
jgi:hypothetical protein